MNHLQIRYLQSRLTELDYPVRPRTCRLYPVTVAPGKHGKDFEQNEKELLKGLKHF